ncbi:Holliday junction branch migration DNA helicase RuvB [Ureaplasma canigenitalium]|uniref:Holliday junction branch migration DNA helicase RuvB n=1 Tax=Ureaplasma canigenitalium TaxID=42092 RepID=UPI0004E0DA8D|nr:Holliday junction branch migration DNA helicase RuvB [Ureaplasma canigenitalium]
MVNLRPNYLREFIGKDALRQNIFVFLDAAKRRNTCIDHILFHGLAGVGKTSLAMIIANEMNTKIHIAQGNNLTKPIDIINLLSLINENDVVFIDEIHAAHPSVLETLYSIMEDFVIDISIGKDFNRKQTRVPVPKFSLIAATTMSGRMPKPLEERFGFVFYINEYTNKEIEEILKVNMKKLDFYLTDSDVELIASHTKGIPRIANRLLKRVVDFKLVDEFLDINEIFRKIKIFDGGLEEYDVKYLEMLFYAENEVGIKSIAQSVNIDQYTVEMKIEPYLLKKHFILKTPRGRRITSKGIEYLKNNNLIK